MTLKQRVHKNRQNINLIPAVLVSHHPKDIYETI